MRLSGNRGVLGRSWVIILLIAVVRCNDCLAENPDSTFQKIKDRATLIGHASSLFGVNPAFLSAVIYTERALNYDWTDQTYDLFLFEKLGLNSSIGFCQIKIKTAYFIEYQFKHADAPYFPGRKFAPLIALSGSKNELLQKITDDSLNICYAAAYLRMMLSRWAKAGHPIEDRPDVLGTLYSTGLYYNDGSERQPNKRPVSNAFGNRVKQAVPIFLPLFKR
jgi:hypothetical protein